MNFTAIVTEILGMTKRPDKIQDIRREVNAAILWYSSEHDYRRDLLETTIVISPAAYEKIVDLATLTRFRKVSYIKYAGTKRYVEELKGLKLTKDCEILDKWYLSGNSINIKLRAEAAALDFGYYQYPEYKTDALPEYWMLDGNWSAILQRAAAAVFNSIGDANSSQIAARAALEQGTIFKSDYIRGSQHDG